MTTLLVILGVFIALMVALQVLIVVKARRRRGKFLEGLGGELGEAVASGARFLVYFYSPGCAACRTQTPIIDQLIEEGLAVLKVNVAEDFAVARAFGVMATPTMVVVDRSRIAEMMVGARSEPYLREALL